MQSQAALGDAQAGRLEAFAKELSAFSQSASDQIGQLRAGVNQSLQTNADLSKLMLERVDASASALNVRMQALEQRSVEELSAIRRDALASAEALRDRVTAALTDAAESSGRKLADMSRGQEQQWTAFRAEQESLRRGVEGKVESLRDKVDLRLQELQRDNAEKLEEMRATVDEKLHTTLEARLGERCPVTERLEQVHRGIGEMQALASGVGMLKPRARATSRRAARWAKCSWQTLLEQVFAPTSTTRTWRRTENG